MSENIVLSDEQLVAMTEADLRAFIATNASTMPMADLIGLPARYAKVIKAHEAAQREADEKALADITLKVKEAIDKTIDKLTATMPEDLLKRMAGVWYARDFGDESASCRLTKSTPKASTSGAPKGTGSGSYVSVDVKSSELLDKVGSHVYFAEATTAKIEGVEVSFAAGTTLKEAWEYSSNGGWRNRVRMALLKEAGMLPTK